jgi:hypothetical protein
MRAMHCLACMALLLLFFANGPAHAGLIGNGTNTVDPLFYLGDQIPADLEDEGTQTIKNPGGAQYPDGPVDESRIDVADTTITIINDSTFPYCSTALPCTDIFTGFVFDFSSGVDISGVSVDAATAADMQPVSLSFSSAQIVVGLTGDAPALGDELVLDLSFPSGGGPSSVPEPASLAILGTGLIGLLIRRRRRAGGTKKGSSSS